MSSARFTLLRTENFEQTVRKSRFLATAGPVTTEEEARQFLHDHRKADAGHNCWAFRTGMVARSNDDGEPGGTAGRPILAAIDAAGMDNVAVIVSRWFGGILLGSGGLMRAYGQTASACLQAAARIEVVATTPIAIACGFADTARIRQALQSFAGTSVEDELYGAEGVTLLVRVPEPITGEVAKLIGDITRGQARIRDNPS